MGAARCSTCHLSGNLSDVNEGKLHKPADVLQSAAYAERSATKLYRTTPLRGLWHAPQLKGPYFHDGSAPTLEAAVEHEAKVAKVNLTDAQKHDLVEYLKTL
jgi:cytochrome c peroxidase